MKWIELNDGVLVNLENLSCITITRNEISYCDVSDLPIIEIFKTPEEAKSRMSMLKQMLI